MSGPTIILASQSPRRRQLLEEAGYRFRVVAPSDSAECGVCSGESPAAMVARLARQKAADVVARVEKGIVVACDTVAECCGQILGKPNGVEHAHGMLQLLSGREHRVFSGLCLWDAASSRHAVEVATTRLVMDPLTAEQIADYLDTELWEGKAGAFGYQDGHDWLHVLEGSESNVVGMPMELLEQMLRLFPGVHEVSP